MLPPQLDFIRKATACLHSFIPIWDLLRRLAQLSPTAFGEGNLKLDDDVLNIPLFMADRQIG